MSIKLIRNESGYSLVEVMVAIMILAIAIIPMVSMFDTGLKVATQGSDYDRGRTLASEKLEEIRALPFKVDPNPPADSVVEIYPPVNGPAGGGPVACTGPIAAGFSCQVETTYVLVGASAVEPNSSARTMLEVKVSVTWDGGGKSYTTTGLVSKGTR